MTSYKIYRDGGSIPIATPTSTTYNDTGLTASAIYTYTVRACDAADNCSAQSMAVSSTTSPSTPPVAGGEWILVPGSATLGTGDFYVMKYEAKDVSGVATSTAGVTPWVNINQPNAITECSNLGSRYHLLTIPEVQTINRNIEAQAANWANGTIGSLVSAGGGLKRGNVGITDSASYIGATPEFGTGRNAKASLALSNGGVIWDWSGNVSEWIYGAGANGTMGTPNGVTFLVSCAPEWSTVALDEERQILGPSNSNYTNLYGVGKYCGPNNGVNRGGKWSQGTTAGVFALSYVGGGAPTNSAADNGFRCGR